MVRVPKGTVILGPSAGQVTSTFKDLVRKAPAARRPLIDPTGPKFRLEHNVLTLILPPPHAGMNAHNKGHWHTKGLLIKALKFKAAERVRLSKISGWPAALVEYRFFFADAIHRDEANAVQSQKPAIDGAVEAALIPDDCYTLLHTASIVCTIDRHNPRTEIRFRKSTPERLQAMRDKLLE